MSLVRFLVILGFGTALSWTAWALVLTTLDPVGGGLVALFLFYSSFFLAVFGTISVIGFFVRYWLERESVLFRQIAIALRHGLLFGGGATLALLMQSRRLLTVWSGGALILLIIVIELFSLAGQTRRSEVRSA